MNWFGQLVVYAVGIFLVYFLFFTKPRRKKPAKPSKSSKKSGYEDLLRWTRGDREQAERLIALEAKRHPTLNRAAHIRAAVERFERDNR
jgi:hypothetical protein